MKKLKHAEENGKIVVTMKTIKDTVKKFITLKIEMPTFLFLIISIITIFYIILMTEKNKISDSYLYPQSFDAITGASSLAHIGETEKTERIFKEVLKKTQWVAIVSWDETSPHVVGTWGDYVETANDAKVLIIPSGGHYGTEQDLKKNNKLLLLMAFPEVKNSSESSGQACVIYGEGEIQTEGEYARLMKKRFEWARGALVVKVKKIIPQL